MKTVYRVVVRRDPEDARFWLADVDGLPGAHTSSRSLATLNHYVREVIVLAADLPDEADQDLELEWVYRTGDDDVDREAEQLRHLRAEVDPGCGQTGHTHGGTRSAAGFRARSLGPGGRHSARRLTRAG